MKVYLIAHIEVTNPELMEEYRAQVPKIVAKYQGKYLVRGGKTEVIEGDYFKHRIVLLEFPNKECANNFYNSDDYAPLKMLRLEAGNNSSVLVEGVE